jgi:predicted transposase YdaD
MYLDELEIEAEPSLGVSMVRLVVEPEKSAVNQAKGLIAKAQREIGDRITQRKILESTVR